MTDSLPSLPKISIDERSTRMRSLTDPGQPWFWDLPNERPLDERLVPLVGLLPRLRCVKPTVVNPQLFSFGLELLSIERANDTSIIPIDEDPHLVIRVSIDWELEEVRAFVEAIDTRACAI